MRIYFLASLLMLQSALALGRNVNETIWDAQVMSVTTNSNPFNLESVRGYDIIATVTKDSPANDTAISGIAEVQTMTFPAKADLANADYVEFFDASGAAWAVALTKPATEIETMTFASKAGTGHQDYLVFHDYLGGNWAVALTKPVAEVDTLNFPAKASLVDGDFVKFFDGSGIGWAVALDTTGGAAHAPTGATWTGLAAGKKSYCDISGQTTAAQVATAVKTCLNALTGFTAAITASDGAADGHLSLTNAVKAPVTDPVPHNREETPDPTEVVSFSAAPGKGTFKLSYNGNKTGFLNYNDSAATIQTALRLVTGLGSVTVAGTAATTITVTFAGVDGTPATLAVTDNTLAIANVTEIQRYVWAVSPDEGQYKVEFNGTKSTFIAFDADTATVQTAVRTIPALAAATVSFHSDVDGDGFDITMTGTVGDVVAITITDNTLAASSVPIVPTVSEVTKGTETAVTGSAIAGSPGSAAGTITGVETTAGVASTAPSGAAYTAISSGHKTLCDISATSTNVQVAAAVELCVDAMSGLSALITTDDSAADGTMLFTSAAAGAVADATPHNAGDSGAGSITSVTGTQGVTAASPTGAIWTSIASGKKVLCDVSAASTAAQVAAAVELCVDGMTGLTAKILTDDSAADGTMLFTQVESGPTVNPVPKSSDDGTAGTILGVQTTGGVAGKVSVSADTIELGAHGYSTGLKGQFSTSSALPTGLSTSTDYWLIVVDADKVKVASSLAHALAGTAINLTAIGVGTQTFNVDGDLEADIKLQKSDVPIGEDPVWVDIADSTQAVDAAGTFTWSGTDIDFRQIRAVFIGDSGEAEVTMHMNAKDGCQ